MDLLEIARKRSTPGILVVDCSHKPVFLGPGVDHFLESLGGTPSIPSKKADLIRIPREIRRLLDRVEKDFSQGIAPSPVESPHQIILIPGKKSTYYCRGFCLRGKMDSAQSPFHMMVLIERLSERFDYYLEKLRNQFDLTARQIDIIKLILKGASNKEIGEKLFISEDTVKAHLKRVMKYMGVNSRVGILSVICRFI